MLAIIAILTLAATSAQAAQLRGEETLCSPSSSTHQQGKSITDNTNAKEIKVESTKIEMASHDETHVLVFSPDVLSSYREVRLSRMQREMICLG